MTDEDMELLASEDQGLDRIHEEYDEVIRCLTERGERVCDRYVVDASYLNKVKRNINYLTGLLPKVKLAKGAHTPSIYWAFRKYKLKESRKPIETYLSGINKNPRQKPRRYTRAYLSNFVCSEEELNLVMEYEMELDAIRRDIFYLSKLGITLRKVIARRQSQAKKDLEEA